MNWQTVTVIRNVYYEYDMYYSYTVTTLANLTVKKSNYYYIIHSHKHYLKRKRAGQPFPNKQQCGVCLGW